MIELQINFSEDCDDSLFKLNKKMFLVDIIPNFDEIQNLFSHVFRAATGTPFGGTIPHFAFSYPRKTCTPGVQILYPIWIFKVFLSLTVLFC